MYMYIGDNWPQWAIKQW